MKGKRYNGLLEWIVDREGHEFLVEVDRNYIKDPINWHGLREKFIEDMNIPKDNLTKK